MATKQIPLFLALALALAAMASGCARDESQPGAAGTDQASPEAAHAAGADTHAGAGTSAHADDADHAHLAVATPGIDFEVPEGHEPWAPDAPLIEGMSRVRAAVGALDATTDAASARAHAAEIDAAIEYMFANCSLDTEPDIALHALLARLMAGTQALHADPLDATPVADMQLTLENYANLFDDPNTGAQRR